ncbi:hypothetical protein FA13DRAFT_1792775 [Coprinellus micaceus]|uniref:Uncharacterized protein n=1 Tax=Coprinellus micaceus TaxID=71717 RepID=A0A4Y7T778_COPMI|nr:hypothetical protein FA13DRAFT_1792775 [Coprinellus micaceus]
MNAPTWTTLRTLILTCILLGATAAPVNHPSDPQTSQPNGVAGSTRIPERSRWYPPRPQTPATGLPHFEETRNRPWYPPRPQTPGTGLLHFGELRQPTQPSPLRQSTEIHQPVPRYPAGRPPPHRQETLPVAPALPNTARPGPRRQQTLPAPLPQDFWSPNQVIPQVPYPAPYPPGPGQRWHPSHGTGNEPEGPFIPPNAFPNPPPTNGHDRVGDEAGQGMKTPADAAPGGSGTLQRGTKSAPLPKGGVSHGVLPKQSGLLNQSGPRSLAKALASKIKKLRGATPLKKTVPSNRLSSKGRVLRGAKSSQKPSLLAKRPTKQGFLEPQRGVLTSKRPVPVLKGSKSRKPVSDIPKKPVVNAKASQLQARPPAAPRKGMARVEMGATKM